MKYAFCAALAVSFILPGISYARDQQTIVVESQRTPAMQWASVISRDLENTIQYPWFGGLQAPPSGIVTVRFDVAGDGRAGNVSIVRHSGNYKLDRAAIDAVVHLRSLHPTAGILTTNQLVQANIYFAQDANELALQSMQLRRERAVAVAEGKSDSQIVALNLDVRAPG